MGLRYSQNQKRCGEAAARVMVGLWLVLPCGSAIGSWFALAKRPSSSAYGVAVSLPLAIL